MKFPRARLGLTFLPMLSLGTAAHAFNPVAGDFAKADATNIRVMAWNLENHFGPSATQTEIDLVGRVVNVLKPDIVTFEETDASDTAAAFKTRLEVKTGGTWYTWQGRTDGFDRNMLASRYPLSMQIQDVTPSTNLGLRGVTAALVDLPNATYGTTNLYMMGLHCKSGGTTTDPQKRQMEADSIISWIRDIKTAGSEITLPSGTPIVYAGDFNLDYLDEGETGGYFANTTLLTGNIYDNAKWGADTPPDWDGTSNSDAAPYDHVNGEVKSQPATSTPDSRLDRIYYSDSAIHVQNRFILNTLTMAAGALTTAGLQSGDTNSGGNAPDHLPLVVDFVLGADPNPPGEIVINEFSYDDNGTDDRSFVELKNIGGQSINLEAPIDYVLLRGTNIPTTANGVEDVARYYDLRGVVPPGGFFVLYDNGGDSAGVQATIESTLPALQRMRDSNFTLDNTANSALALVQRAHANGSSQASDVLVEALLYGWNNSSASYVFETDAVTVLPIALSGSRLGPALANVDTTFSRKVGDSTKSSYANWVIGDAATPGTENNTPLDSAIRGSGFAVK